MKNLAIIPARGGSKGVPGKNIKNLGGAPLIWHTIQAAVFAGNSEYAEPVERLVEGSAQLREDRFTGFTAVFNTIVVTSEDDDILESARECFARYGGLDDRRYIVYKRDLKLAQDHVQTDEVILDTLRSFELNGDEFDNICLLQPTSPFRDYQHITESYEQFMGTGGVNCLLSGIEHDSGYHWKTIPTARLREYVEPIEHNPTFRMGRQWEQPLPTIFRENGAIYWFDAKQFSLRRFYRMEPFVMYPMTEEESVDINNLGDWAKAEEIISKRWGAK